MADIGTWEFKQNIWDAVGYKPHHLEVERFHQSTSRTKVVVCPARSSKSYSSAKDLLPDLFVSNTRHWILGPSYSLAEKEFRYIHEDLMLLHSSMGLPKPTRKSVAPKSGGLFLEYGAPWNVIIEGKTADNPQSLLGEKVNTILYSEAAQLPRLIYEKYAHPRTATTQGTERIATTPESKAEWVFELFEKGRAGHPGIESFNWDVTANPEFPLDELEDARRRLGEDNPYFREQYLGEWVVYSGLVYPTFDKNAHVIEPFRIPDHWPRYRGIDFGSRDPFVCLWCAVGQHGELYFYREYYETQSSIPTIEHARKIKEMSGAENIRMTVCDPAGKQLINDFMSHGISPIKAGNNDRTAGRIRVMEYMQPVRNGAPPYSRHAVRSNGRIMNPLLYIFNNCENLIQELKWYRWKESRGVESEKERTEGSDHAVDCMRYLCVEHPSPIKTRAKSTPYSFDWWAKRNSNHANGKRR